MTAPLAPLEDDPVDDDEELAEDEPEPDSRVTPDSPDDES
jgi:hypothetical protein